MKKLKWTWQKIVSTVLGILGIGTLTSCYGVVGMDYANISGRVMGDIDGDGIEEPVSGIKISISADPNEEEDYQYSYNDPDSDPEDSYEGRFDFAFSVFSEGESSYKVTFTDVDGEENGSFETLTKKVVITPENDSIDLGDVILKRKN